MRQALEIPENFVRFLRTASRPWLASLAILGTIGAGEDPPTAASSKLVLFNGKGLDGWRKVESYKAGEVKVEGGAIVLGQGGPMTGVVSTREGLPTLDYELTFEARRIVGEDFFAAATFPVGGSFVTLVNGGWGGSVTGLSSLNGADASENDSRRFVKYRNGDWYRFRVRVTGRSIGCWVDDAETFAVDYRDRSVKTRLETRSNQPLGFSSYRSVGAVRAVEVRRLSAAEVAAVDKAAEG